MSLANVGDFIRVSFTAEWTTPASAGQHGFRFGLFDNNGSPQTSNLTANNDPAFNPYRGYFSTFQLGTNASAQSPAVYARTGGNNAPLSNADPANLTTLGQISISSGVANTAYDFSMEITRISPTEFMVDVVGGPGGGSHTTSVISAETFNTFFLLNTPQTNLDSMIFSNFQLVTPEPGRAMLLCLGLLTLLRRRRSWAIRRSLGDEVGFKASHRRGHG